MHELDRSSAGAVRCGSRNQVNGCVDAMRCWRRNKNAPERVGPGPDWRRRALARWVPMGFLVGLEVALRDSSALQRPRTAAICA
jgi:hypothetical protein